MKYDDMSVKPTYFSMGFSVGVNAARTLKNGLNYSYRHWDYLASGKRQFSDSLQLLAEFIENKAEAAIFQSGLNFPANNTGFRQKQEGIHLHNGFQTGFCDTNASYLDSDDY